LKNTFVLAGGSPARLSGWLAEWLPGGARTEHVALVSKV